MRSSLQKPKTLLTLALLLLGFLHLAYLLKLPHDAVFFSGDGGLKYLMSQQFLRGNVSPALDLPVAPEAAELWLKGFYPFDIPFVYLIDGRRVVSFPLYFSLASVPFLAAIGWRGLYVLPAAAVLFVWIWIALCSRALQFSKMTLCAVLVSIIFASPLTLYGAMYWEHAPAAFMAAIPLSLILRKRNDIPTVVSALALGAVAGTGVLMRPEVVVCVMSAIGISLICFGKERLRYTALFSAGFFILVGVFFAFNQLIYGHILGLHSAQVIDKVHSNVLLWPARQAIHRARELLGLCFLYWPLCLFALAGLPFALLSSYSRKRELLACLLVIVVSVPLIALIVPNCGGKQWGPRYLLVLLPWGVIMVGLIVEAITQSYGRWVKGPALLLLFVCLALGLKANTWNGTRHLAEDYSFRILPALEVIKKQPQQIVIVTQQWIAQELAAVANEKTFLWVRSEEDFSRAKALLYQQAVQSILFVAYTEEAAPKGIVSQEIGRSSSYVVRTVRIEE